MIMENYLSLETKDGPMDVFSAAPASDNPLPVVIVIQEAFGVNAHIKDVCSRLAQAGYLALAPELFHRIQRHLTIDYTDREKIFPLLEGMSNEDLLTDLSGLINFVWKLPQADIRNVYCLGFCVGGFTSLLASLHFPLRGAIAYYGAGVVENRKGFGIRPFVQELASAKCPLLLFYGEKDASIPESDRFAIRAQLDNGHIPHEMIVYGDADHGFFCDQRKSYQAQAANAAWTKTLQWLGEVRAH